MSYANISILANLFTGYQNRIKLNERNGGLDFKSLFKSMGSERLAYMIYKRNRSILKKFKL